jgi:hypothetical protein
MIEMVQRIGFAIDDVTETPTIKQATLALR